MVRAPLHFHGRIPVPEVAPLTYRDGVTHLELVYELSEYLKNILHPSLQSTVNQVVADAERLLSEANAQYVDGVQEFQRIHDAFMSDVEAALMALNDSAVSDLVDDETSLLGKSLRAVFVSVKDFDHRLTGVDNALDAERSQRAEALDGISANVHETLDSIESNVSETVNTLENTVSTRLDGAVSDVHEYVDEALSGVDGMVQHRGMVIHAFSSQAKEHGVHLVADGDLQEGVVSGTDNTESFERLFQLSRDTGRTVYVPAGKYRMDGEADISGVQLVGDYSGYRNTNGTVFIGTGENVMFDQKKTAASGITMHISNVRLDNACIGVRLTYTIYSKFSGVVVMDSVDNAFMLGDENHEAVGPIWNVFDRCIGRSQNRHGLYMAGREWNNANVFETCVFRSANRNSSAVNIDTRYGYGALNNVFNNCEIHGSGAGVVLSRLNSSTRFNWCYFESTGPAVVVYAQTRDLQLNGGVWGSLRNDNGWNMRSFVYHETGSLRATVSGGWVTLGGGAHRDNLSFITSNTSSSCIVDLASYTTQSVAASGWKFTRGSVMIR